MSNGRDTREFKVDDRAWRDDLLRPHHHKAWGINVADPFFANKLLDYIDALEAERDALREGVSRREDANRELVNQLTRSDRDLDALRARVEELEVEVEYLRRGPQGDAWRRAWHERDMAVADAVREACLGEVESISRPGDDAEIDIVCGGIRALDLREILNGVKA